MDPQEEATQRRRAMRALLTKPLLTVGADEDALRLVRRHAAHLRDWFGAETGWRLVVDAESARLFKVSATTDDATRPAQEGKGKAPFGRRRYVLLCLALAVLERADTQITLGRLAEGVLVAAGEPELSAAGVEFTLSRRDERTDLVAVVRLLLAWGALERVAGEEDSYLSDTGDVLYDVRRRVLAALLTTGRGPSTVTEGGFEQRLKALSTESMPDTEDLRRRTLRHQLTRRLLDDPVLYYDDLTDDERAYLINQRVAITRRIEDATGLVAEMRAEGIAMVDPDDDLTDVRMPEQRTDGHVTLLIAEYLSGRVGEPVSIDALRAHVRVLAREHTSYWRRGVTEPGADAELLEIALTKLRALRLVADSPPEAVRALPAIARYSVQEAVIRDGSEPRIRRTTRKVRPR
ncbi:MULTISPECIES: TIGR02678 family protein [unclassified Nocardia]|uniref:TIGR02678 family protein n=1 Tax=unclassified Nocardia TaxID=2637762 RepID=UPI001CE4A833|nr:MULTISPECIES: TIGR02678 family protein [unclassified Nocardia]